MTHPDDATIQSWCDDALDPAEADRVAAHVAACPRCAAVAREVRAVHTAFARWEAAVPELPDDFADRVLVAAERSAEVARRPVTARAPARRVVYPLMAMAAAGVLAVFVGQMPSPTRPEVPSVPSVAPSPSRPAHPVTPEAPVTVGSSDGPGSAEVTRVDVVGARGYTVLEVPGTSPGSTTAVVWIQDAPEGP